MKQKPVIYYDDMIPPTYIRLVSERLNLDHIVHTEAMYLLRGEWQ